MTATYPNEVIYLQAKITKAQQNDRMKKQCRINIAAVISDRIWSKQGL